MSLFLIVSPLLAAASIYPLLTPHLEGSLAVDSDDSFRETIRRPLVWSFLLSVPLLLVYLGVGLLIRPEYRPGAIYLAVVLHEYVAWFLPVLGLIFLFNRRARRRTPVEVYRAHLIAFSVFALVLALTDAVAGRAGEGAGSALLVPLTRVGAIVLFPYALTVADTSRGGGWAVVLVGIYPFVAALTSMWAQWIRPGLSLMAAVVSLSVALAGVVLIAYRGRPQTSQSAHDSQPSV